MESYPGISQIIGYNPLSTMFNNHHNHARFMANVFRFNAFDLLARMVVWVYRTYHAHGFSFDYFPMELCAWQKSVAAHLEVHQSQAINAIYQWMLDRHQDMVQLSQEPVHEQSPLDPAWQSTRDDFLQALLHGDSKSCLSIRKTVAKTPVGLQTFYLEIIQPCMYEIGILWERSEITVAQEHLASAIVGRLMAVLHPSPELLQQTKGTAVVTTVSNELHEIGARCVADLLALDGWQIKYLGANTPPDELIKFLFDLKPNLLALSVTMPFNLDVTQDLITNIRNQPEMVDLKVMVGGQAFNLVPELWKITGADGYAPNAQRAVELARNWRLGNGPLSS
jgi:methanogenic corrinoid protein MtbC1